jgi:hypothetical protein
MQSKVTETSETLGPRPLGYGVRLYWRCISLSGGCPAQSILNSRHEKRRWCRTGDSTAEPKCNPDKLRRDIHFRNSGTSYNYAHRGFKRPDDREWLSDARRKDFGSRANCRDFYATLLSLVLVRRIILLRCAGPSGKRALRWLPTAGWHVPLRG